MKEKGKGYWINENWQQEWNKTQLKSTIKYAKWMKKCFMNAINRKIQSSISIGGWNVTTSNDHKNVIDYTMK